jgi:hypothetical protein
MAIEITEGNSGSAQLVIGLRNSTTLDATEQNHRRLEARRVTGPRPNEVPTPPAAPGSRFLTYKQDPSVGDSGIRTVFVSGLILNGPRDARIQAELAGTTPVARNTNGDFIFPLDSNQFDCAHTWAVVRETLTMCERLHGAPIPWAWNTGGNTDLIKVFPHAGVTANAFYSRTAKALKFFFFTPQGSTSQVFTCQSLDIVAHEAGHAILDGLKPGWLSNGSPPQTGGLHESFGDLVAVFLALSQLDQAEAVMALSRNNLHAKTFIAHVAEQFGAALGKPFGLRNADNDLKLSEVGNEVHAISQVFTGGIYDIMADIFAFELDRQGNKKRPSLILVEVASHLSKLVLDAIIAAPDSNAVYADVINKMLVLSKNQNDPPIYRTFIRNQFTFREVVVSPTPLDDMMAGLMPLGDPNYADGEDVLVLEQANTPASLVAQQNRSLCCGTMQLPEFRRDESDLSDGKSLSDDELLAAEYKRLARAFK